VSEPSQVVLVRYSGEIGTKARPTRGRFERRLLHNLEDALRSRGIGAAPRRTRNRIFVETDHPEAASVASRVFGVQSVARATRHPAEKLEPLVAEAEARFRAAVSGRRFAVRARRVGERSRIPLSSRELERALGTALLPASAGVDLGHPEVTVSIELHDIWAYLVEEAIAGPGGLPLGVEGRAVALMSGGFDSAVAAWQMLRRGVSLDYVFCNLGGAAHRLGTLRVAKVLADRWSYGGTPRLYAVDFDPIAREIRAHTTPRLWQVILKRQMLRAAQLIARERRASAIVTGESVGQVSSQTLPNLATISEAASLPILRPLVGMNKDEIIRSAERIGTAALSAVVDEYCAMATRRPATAAALADVLAEEARLDAATLERLVAERASFDLRGVDVDAAGAPDLEIDEIPAGATVIDLRSRTAHAAWHYPGALRLDFDRALAAWRSFDRSRVYVLYCEFGLKSAHLAELMRAEGFETWNFRGGLRGLLVHARARGLPVPAAASSD
jgi:tRNA uracil 4-sulfurtransferase